MALRLNDVLGELTWTLILVGPLVLIAAALAGYWMSRRAQLRRDRAPRIPRTTTSANVAAEPLLRTEDELDRLSETLAEMVARLEDAYRRVRGFDEDASHDLRTLAAIRTAAEEATRQPDMEPEYAEALERILAESERTTQLIEDLLRLARVEPTEASLAVEPVDLAAIARDAAETTRPMAERAGVRFSATLPHRLDAQGDPRLLRRLFLILLDNAVSYTAAGGAVSLALTSTATHVMIDVRDSGIGIASDHLPHVFEPFFRVSPDPPRATGGIGLGLSIAQWIATAHRGTIAVESTPGRGSIFRVRLPRGARRTESI